MIGFIIKEHVIFYQIIKNLAEKIAKNECENISNFTTLFRLASDEDFDDFIAVSEKAQHIFQKELKTRISEMDLKEEVEVDHKTEFFIGLNYFKNGI